MADPEKQTEVPPEFVTLLDESAKEGIDIDLIASGVKLATEEISRAAALQLAQGMYPVSFFAMLQRLKLLGDAVKRAQDQGVTFAAVTGPSTSVT